MSRRMANSRLVAQLQRNVEDGFYGDTASILQDTRASYDAAGQPVNTTVTTPVSCSFTDAIKMSPTALEKWKAFADISQIEAEIRYNSLPVPAKGNRVTLTGRFDSTEFIDSNFEIIGIQDRDVFGHVCALKKVEV